MIHDFHYHRPSTLSEALSLATSLDGTITFLGGGTEILPRLRRGLDATDHLIALRDLEDLRCVVSGPEGVDVGAMTSLAQVADSADLRHHLPALAETAGSMAAAQIRNRGTLGGNFCGSVPCADTPPVCIAGDARLLLMSGQGERWLAADAFIHGPRQNALRPGEVLLRVRIPPQPHGSGTSYQRFALRGSNAVAVAGVAARLVLDDANRITEARVATTAVAPTPNRISRAEARLQGETAGDDAFREAGKLASETVQPICDVRGSVEFRRDLTRVLTVRALRDAAHRARAAKGVGR